MEFAGIEFDSSKALTVFLHVLRRQPRQSPLLLAAQASLTPSASDDAPSHVPHVVTDPALPAARRLPAGPAPPG